MGDTKNPKHFNMADHAGGELLSFRVFDPDHFRKYGMAADSIEFSILLSGVRFDLGCI